MRVAVIGRTRPLLVAARKIVEAGHAIPLVITAAAEAHYDASASEFEEFAKSVGAVFFCNADLHSEESLERIAEATCEVAISINWPRVIKAKVCDLFPKGILNVHAGDLPRYRGNACPNWAILNGEDFVGLCIHKMIAGELDSGPIAARDRFKLGADSYIGEVYDWIHERAPSLLFEAVARIASGNSQFEEQSANVNDWLRCYPRRPEDGRVDWSQTAAHVYRLIRASSRPFAGAYTTLEGSQNVTIWKARPAPHLGPFCAVPGQMLYQTGSDPVIACADAPLRLEEIEIEGCTAAEPKRKLVKSLRQRLK